MSYLSVNEFLSADLGSGADALELDDVEALLSITDSLIDAHIFGGDDFTLGYHEVKRERHRWRGDTFSAKVFHRPVRTVTNAHLVTGTSLGQERGYSVRPWPQQQRRVADDLPLTFGDISLRRETSELQATSLLIAVGALPLVAFQHPEFEVSYTAGYDDGVSPPPAPGAPSLASGLGIDPGDHVWAVTHVIAGRETFMSPTSPIVTVGAGLGRAAVSLPLGPARTSARRVYRSRAALPTPIDPFPSPIWPLLFVGEVADNTTTTVLDEIPDAELGGQAPGDGVSLPAPKWLKDAARLIARDMVGEWMNAKRGMTGLLQISIAGTSYRRPQLRPKIDYAINPWAKAILSRHPQVWAA